MKNKQPRFHTTEEEARFWVTHDITDYVGQLEGVNDVDKLFVLSPALARKIHARAKRRLISLRLSVWEMEQSKEAAKKLKKMEREILRSVKVRITFYAPSLKGINSDSNPKKTATMTKPIPGRTCAISRGLVKAGWLGSKIYIPEIGIRYASDIMGKSINGKVITKRIDICVGKNEVKNQTKRFKKTHVIANVLRK